MIKKMDLKEQFLKECGVDLTDYEYAGKFPSRNKKGVWGNIPRGEGWKRYAEWLESKLKNNGGLGAVINWQPCNYKTGEGMPKEYGKYLICRKDGKIHWETYNGSGWAYNGNVIKFWAVIKTPCL